MLKLITTRGNTEVLSRNNCWRAKQKVLYILTVCVCVCVALFIQHVKSVRRIILSSVACPTPPYFFRIIS